MKLYRKSKNFLRFLSILISGALSFTQMVPLTFAHDFLIPGGTSPTAPQPPSKGQSAAQNACGDDPVAQCMADPVHLDRGEFFIKPTDLIIPVRGLSIALTRHYRSQSAYNGSLGYGWDFTYNRRLRKLQNGNIVYLSGDNRQDEFIYNASTYNPSAGVYRSLVQEADGTWTLTDVHGEIQRFDIDGKLTQISDRSGNALTFAYDPAGKLPIQGPSAYFVNQTTGVIARDFRLTNLTDSLGRQITFTYNADGRIAAITDWAARAWNYTYDAQGNLTVVTQPATPEAPQGAVTTYAYDSNHNLTSILYPNQQPNGAVYVANIYDLANDRITSQSLQGATTTFSYDTQNRTTTVVDGVTG
ncbi:MAG: hypothetical protein HYU33_03305, partial [Candidatus Omnitrophica bacterium]|nr:hypothetical protein [Candidatus Omnitrophota bacterium]